MAIKPFSPREASLARAATFPDALFEFVNRKLSTEEPNEEGDILVKELELLAYLKQEGYSRSQVDQYGWRDFARFYDTEGWSFYEIEDGKNSGWLFYEGGS